jgi:hypothetical protein
MAVRQALENLFEVADGLDAVLFAGAEVPARSFVEREIRPIGSLTGTPSGSIPSSCSSALKNPEADLARGGRPPVNRRNADQSHATD